MCYNLSLSLSPILFELIFQQRRLHLKSRIYTVIYAPDGCRLPTKIAAARSRGIQRVRNRLCTRGAIIVLCLIIIVAIYIFIFMYDFLSLYFSPLKISSFHRRARSQQSCLIAMSNLLQGSSIVFPELLLISTGLQSHILNIDDISVYAPIDSASAERGWTR